MKKFYDSANWKYLRDEYAKSQDYICERCGKICYQKSDSEYIRLKALGEDVVYGIVHHKEYLKDSPELATEWDNLELLCIKCHNTEHKTTSPEVRKDIVGFDSEGRIIWQNNHLP